MIVRLAIAAIALSVAVMIITVGVVVGFKNEIESKITGFAAPIQISGEFLNSSFENKPFTDSALTRKNVESFDQVEHIQPFALKPGILKNGEDFEGVVLKGVDSSYKIDFFTQSLLKGRFIEFKPNQQDKEVVVSNTLANKLMLDTGMSATIWFVQDPPLIKKVRVVGIYQTDIEEVDNIYILTDLDIIRQVSGWRKNEIGGYEVLVSATEKDEISELNSNLRFAIDINLNSMSIMNRFPQIFDWLGLLNQNVQIIIILMTIVAVINMVTALLIMILERTQMVGILKSLGYQNAGLQRVFVYNAALFIGYGLLIGNVLGLGLMALQHHFQIVSLSADYYVTHVPVEFNWLYFLLIDLGTLLVCSLAMFLPARFVTRIVPVKALRFN
ncbi:MAG: ABC transporter permease [Bacteroidia bacterium]